MSDCQRDRSYIRPAHANRRCSITCPALSWNRKRRGWDSNPQALTGAAFRVRCIAVLPPLRFGIRYSVLSFRYSVFSFRYSVLPGFRALSFYSFGTRYSQSAFGARYPEYRIPSTEHRNGRGGIRTHEALVAPTRSPGVRLKPLGHPSGKYVGAGWPAHRRESGTLLFASHARPLPTPRAAELPRLDSNQESLGPEPSVLPITPRGTVRRTRPRRSAQAVSLATARANWNVKEKRAGTTGIARLDRQTGASGAGRVPSALRRGTRRRRDRT